MAAEVFILIAYDISSNRRRARLVKLLSDHGQRVNLSVFECSIKRPHYDELRKKIAKLINPRLDNVLFYELCANCKQRVEKLGCASIIEKKKKVVVI